MDEHRAREELRASVPSSQSAGERNAPRSRARVSVMRCHCLRLRVQSCRRVCARLQRVVHRRAKPQMQKHHRLSGQTTMELAETPLSRLTHEMKESGSLRASSHERQPRYLRLYRSTKITTAAMQSRHVGPALQGWTKTFPEGREAGQLRPPEPTPVTRTSTASRTCRRSTTHDARRGHTCHCRSLVS